MGRTPTNQLDPKVKNVWRINDAIWIGLCYIICLASVLIGVFASGGGGFVFPLGIATVAFAVLAVVFVGVLPSIRYARWRYEVSQDYLEIMRGIIWRKHFVIPFIRVQNTDTRQGPLLRAFGLAGVTVSTAAGEHEIPGLAVAEADALRDRAAELARLAREDV